MTTVLWVVLAVYGTFAVAGAALYTLARRLARATDQIHVAFWGTDTNGNPRPRCERCLHHVDDQVDLDHVPGCWAHIPDSPAELTE